MIVPMKKVSLVVMEKDHETSLEKLREVGVLHLEKKDVFSDNLSNLLEKKAKNMNSLGILRRYTKKGSSVTNFPQVTESDLADRVLALAEEKKLLQDQLLQNTKETQRIQEWGDFDPVSFAHLKKNGLTLIPYKVSSKKFTSLDPQVEYIVISKDSKAVRFLAVGEAIPGFTPFVFSPQSLSQINERTKNIGLRIAEIEAELENIAFFTKKIIDNNNHLQVEIEFETAKAGLDNCEDASVVSLLSGFVPHDKLGELKQAAAEHSWALLAEDVSPEDRPPTLVKNNAFVRIVQPLFSFLGTVPGYKEYDISFSYLIFLCVFFAMIFGDASYGLLLFAMSAAAGIIFKKKTGKFPDASKLFMLLSFCTVVWGAITGSWFAIPTESLPFFLRSLIVSPFNSSGPVAEFPWIFGKLFSLPAEIPVDELKTRWYIQFLCFSLGAIQLVWARGKNIIRQLPSLTAFAQTGWLAMMIGIYFLVLSILLNVALPPYAVWLIGSGVAVYFIFAEQNGGNFFVNIGRSFSNFLPTFLNAVGSFADVISYIRLFAVGLSGSIIAESFNNMAVPAEGFGSLGLVFVLRLLAAVLILLLGHSLNIVMNSLSVIVHGIRLNLLEYAGNHLGMEWSGYAYKPFMLKQKK
jgi:V/A-type H+-transporting ATPase subunit I